MDLHQAVQSWNISNPWQVYSAQRQVWWSTFFVLTWLKATLIQQRMNAHTNEPSILAPTAFFSEFAGILNQAEPYLENYKLRKCNCSQGICYFLSLNNCCWWEINTEILLSNDFLNTHIRSWRVCHYRKAASPHSHLLQVGLSSQCPNLKIQDSLDWVFCFSDH